jgi:hypothetical protein
MKFDERNKKNFKSSIFFISMATEAKLVLPIPIVWIPFIKLHDTF